MGHWRSRSRCGRKGAEAQEGTPFPLKILLTSSWSPVSLRSPSWLLTVPLSLRSSPGWGLVVRHPTSWQEEEGQGLECQDGPPGKKLRNQLCLLSTPYPALSGKETGAHGGEGSCPRPSSLLGHLTATAALHLDCGSEEPLRVLEKTGSLAFRLSQAGKISLNICLRPRGLGGFCLECTGRGCGPWGATGGQGLQRSNARWTHWKSPSGSGWKLDWRGQGGGKPEWREL